jgi:ribose transport system permease protein
MDDAVTKKANVKTLFKTFAGMREFSILVFFIVVCAVMTLLTPNFATRDTLVNVLYNISIDGILAIGMVAALVSGGFDLSVGSILGFTCAINAQMYLAGGINIWLASLLSILVATGIGAANGFFITELNLSPFITTLAMSGIVRGAVYVVTKGVTLSVVGAPASFLDIGKGKTFGIIPNIGIIMIVLAIFFDIMMRRSKIFRKVYYTGSNETAARMSGINTKKVKFWVYVFGGMLAGIGGVLSLMRFSMSAPTLGNGKELLIISAAVIGGCTLTGGEGSVLGVVLGVLLLSVVSSSMTLLQISTFWQQLVRSLILLIAVTIDSLLERYKAKKLMRNT